MKKVTAAFFALLLLILIASTMIAEEAAAPEYSNEAVQNNGAVSSGQVIFALTTGQTVKETDRSQLTISAWLVQGLLLEYMDTDTSCSYIQVRSEGPDLDAFPGIVYPQHFTTPQSLSQVSSELLGLNLHSYSDTQIYKAYQDVLDRLLTYVRQEDSNVDYIPPTDIWWIDWYQTSLILPAGSLIPAVGEQSDDNKVAVYCAMQSLLDLVPEINFHFVYLIKDTSEQALHETKNPEDMQAGNPLVGDWTAAELLSNQPQYASRVTIDRISSSNLALASVNVQDIIKAHINAILEDNDSIENHPQRDPADTWSYVYHYEPVNEQGSVLLIPPDFSKGKVRSLEFSP